MRYIIIILVIVAFVACAKPVEVMPEVTEIIPATVNITSAETSASSPTPEVTLARKRYVTPATLAPDIYARPQSFYRSNNLRRKTGSAFLAKGEPLIIEGYITDLFNVPIEGISVKIWQANAFGYYNHILQFKDDDEHYDTDFAGTGIATTDNLGYYRFLTIMPGYYGNRTPHIHMDVSHPSFQNRELEIYFPNHPRNILDRKYVSMSASDRMLTTASIMALNENNPADGKVALFNITLDVIHPTKSY